VFNADAKTMSRIAPHIQRVLVLDPAPASARLAGELMKSMGAREIALATRTDRGFATTVEFEPQLILLEYAGPAFDGLEFTRRLRRSLIASRQAPVIMITAEATAASIVAARNAGVHEFLRKPYTVGDLFRRVENVTLKPRPWIEAQSYVGPDRRRFNSGEFAGQKKRRTDEFATADAAKAS